MAERRQLPPQIRRVELARRAGSKPMVRYQQKQLRRRYRTEKEARAALAEIQGQVASGTYVQPSTLTLEQACADWLLSRHKIRPTTAAGYEYVLQPVRSELGALSQVRGQLVAEGRLTRNVAALVDRVPGKAKKFQTFTSDQVRIVLRSIADDRNRHAWHLALAGLRRGEIAGQRWVDVDLENRALRIGATRVDVGGRALDQDEPQDVECGSRPSHTGCAAG